MAADEKLNIHPKPLLELDFTPPLCFFKFLCVFKILCVFKNLCVVFTSIQWKFNVHIHEKIFVSDVYHSRKERSHISGKFREPGTRINLTKTQNHLCFSPLFCVSLLFCVSPFFVCSPFHSIPRRGWNEKLGHCFFFFTDSNIQISKSGRGCWCSFFQFMVECILCIIRS